MTYRLVKLLTAVLCVGFLVGCGSGGPGEKKDESFKPVEFENRDNIKYEYKPVALEDTTIQAVSSSDINTYACGDIADFLTAKGQDGWKVFDIVVKDGKKYWLFIKGKDTTYTYENATRFNIPDTYNHYHKDLVSSDIAQLNSYGRYGYERAKIYHRDCAFYVKDDNSYITIDYKSTAKVSYSASIGVLNDWGNIGYQYFAMQIISTAYGSSGGSLASTTIVKQYSDTASQTYQSEYQPFVAYGSNGAKNLLNQLNQEADRGFLFSDQIYVENSNGVVIEAATLYSKHLLNTQKVVYGYLEHNGIDDLVNQLNTVGAQGGLLSHYGNLVIYNTSLMSGLFETKTAIGYNLDCSETYRKIPCKIIY